MAKPVKKSGIPHFGGISNIPSANRSFSSIPSTSGLPRPSDFSTSLTYPKPVVFTSSPNGSLVPQFNTTINTTFNETINSSTSSLETTITKSNSYKRSSFYSSSSPIDKKHIGKEVLVGGTEYGILKYVGPVDFEKGIWCGVELANPVGKHDGLVKGVRYFTCKPNHGCLAPKLKVELAIPEGQSNFERLKSKFEPTKKFDQSGPYSLIGFPGLPDYKDEVRKDCQLMNTSPNLIDKRHTFVIQHEAEKLTLSLTPNSSAFFTKKSPIDLNSQASFDLDESLGILTPDQMCEFPKTPSTDDLRVLLHDFNKPMLLSPTVPESGDLSLGLLNDDLLATPFLNDHSLSNLDTTINMELPLDTKPIILRCEQTPSPEELPLDPISTKSEESKTKSKSLVMSIASITSLDNGYQGDGEMSRPASRGGDHSPTVHKPTTNPPRVIRRPDPMTDSDFFTESDADIHDENRANDRKVQVIDGHLYGLLNTPNPQPFVQQEEMDSSGVFTDLESKHTEPIKTNELDHTPCSDISSKTISENSQLNQNPPESCHSSPSRKSSSPKFAKTKEDAVKKYKMPRRNVQSKVKSMLEGPKVKNVENQENCKPLKKGNNKWDAIMSKITDTKISTVKLKEVKSKVATGLDSNGTKRVPSKAFSQNLNTKNSPNNSTKLKRRTRASKLNSNNDKTTESVHSSLSDISNSLSAPAAFSPKTSSLISLNRSAKRAANTQNNSRCLSPQNSDTTILRYNQGNNSPSTGILRANRTSSLKKSPTPVTSSTNEITPKRFIPPRRIAYNNNAATTNKTTANLNQINSAKDSTRSTGAPITATAKTRCAASVQTTPSEPLIINNQSAADLRPQLKQAALSVEALGVLLQHLVFHYDVFKTPNLVKEYNKLKQDWAHTKLELDEKRVEYRRLTELHKEERNKNINILEKERQEHEIAISNLTDTHRLALLELNKLHAKEKSETEKLLETKQSTEITELTNQINELQKENDRWKTSYENLQSNFDKIRKEHNALDATFAAKEAQFKLEIDKANDKLSLIQDQLKLKETELNQKILNDSKVSINTTVDEPMYKRSESVRLIESDGKLTEALGKYSQLQDETESLRIVLDLKQKECADLRKKCEEAARDAEMLPSALMKVQSLQARVEDLEIQLERKTDFEKQLLQEKKLLMESLQQESEQKKRLIFQNEELKWKLKQNHEVVNVLLSGIQSNTPTKLPHHGGSNHSLNEDNLIRSPHSTCLTRSLQTASFSEKHSEREKFIIQQRAGVKPKEVTHDGSSFFEIEDVSPPSSPKIKAVVEKCDSVSYVLEIDEPPEVLASRIYRRSFRNSTPPKNTPTKSPNLKRYKSKHHPLSLSASETSIGNCDDDLRSKSVCMKKVSDDEEFDFDWKDTTSEVLDFRQAESSITLPALPSELLRSQSVVQSCGGEAMISESNSEDDECSTSMSSERSRSLSDDIIIEHSNKVISEVKDDEAMLIDDAEGVEEECMMDSTSWSEDI